MNWATEYLRLHPDQAKVAFTVRPGDLAAQTSNIFDRVTGATVPIAGHHIPAGVLGLGASGMLVGALGHRHGQEDVKRKLREAGATPLEIARADYLARGPQEGYGPGSAIGAGIAGAGSGLLTGLALQKGLGLTPGISRMGGLGAGLGAAYLASRSSSEGTERRRMKGMEY
jgi:hypothetical protein